MKQHIYRICICCAKQIGRIQTHSEPGQVPIFKDKVSFCGHKIERHGLHKTQKKIEAIVNAPQPTIVSELRSFLGIVNYYARFIANVSPVLHALYNLLERDRK
jgi:hypothetical protein